MAKYFTIAELSRSTTATSQGIDNTPPPDVRVKLEVLINNMLDPIREQWGAPITVNSGFRSLAVNKAVGGAKTSQHMRGEAADLKTRYVADNFKLFKMIAESKLPFGQLIIYPTFVHVSFSASEVNKQEILYNKTYKGERL